MVSLLLLLQAVYVHVRRKRSSKHVLFWVREWNKSSYIHLCTCIIIHTSATLCTCFTCPTMLSTLAFTCVWTLSWVLYNVAEKEADCSMTIYLSIHVISTVIQSEPKIYRQIGRNRHCTCTFIVEKEPIPNQAERCVHPLPHTVCGSPSS